MNTQLLCTFCRTEDLETTIEHIKASYEIAFNSIYVLENTDSQGSLCCTYNVTSTKLDLGKIPPSTISLHRKKSTNTLYTINALNLLVSDLNNGIPDPSFKVPWDNYRNTILVTAYGKLKTIPTKLVKIVKLDE